MNAILAHQLSRVYKRWGVVFTSSRTSGGASHSSSFKLYVIGMFICHTYKDLIYLYVYLQMRS